jgi:preprotein translocase subunit SecE
MQPKGISFDGIPWLVFTGLAQLVEHWSPKPGVGSSSLSTRAKQWRQNTNSGDNFSRCTMIEYIKASFEELKSNVSWPSRDNAWNLTVLVATFSVVFALVIWAIDTVFVKVISSYFAFLK